MDAVAIRQRLALPDDAPDADLAAALQEILAYLASLNRADCGLVLNSTSTSADVLDAVMMSSDARLVSYRQNLVLMQRETEAMRTQVARAHSRGVVEMQAEKGYAISRPIIETLVELHMQKPDEALIIMQCLPNLKMISPLKGRVVQGPVPEVIDE